MPIDYALILAAGLGTRMGPVGKVLPKALWPVFDRPLLELQVAFAKELGARKIFMNAHFLYSEIQTFLNQKPLDLEVMYEPELLLSGGPIHALADRPEIKRKGTLLTLNSDQFYFIQDQSPQDIKTKKAYLWGLKANGQYHEVCSNEQGEVTEIKDGPTSKPYWTYSGQGLFDLSELKNSQGPSSFFETVANYKERSIYLLRPKMSSYWDFGTARRYLDSHLKILDLIRTNQTDPIIDFLIRHKAIDLKKVNKRGYKSDSFYLNENVIILGGQVPTIIGDGIYAAGQYSPTS